MGPYIYIYICTCVYPYTYIGTHICIKRPPDKSTYAYVQLCMHICKSRLRLVTGTCTRRGRAAPLPLHRQRHQHSEFHMVPRPELVGHVAPIFPNTVQLGPMTVHISGMHRPQRRGHGNPFKAKISFCV